MKAGYVLVDCKNLDLTLGSTEQTINGLYDKVVSAHNTGKMIIAENCKWGEQGAVSPMPVMSVKFSGYYILTASTLQVVVTSADKVTIINMAPSEG